jgi:hypothetical protein
MALMSPLQYRWHRIMDAIFGDREIIYEALIHYKANLPYSGVQVAWERDGEFIVGKILVEEGIFIAQGRSAKEFIECVNDALYAAFGVPIKYAEALGGDYRLTPPENEFKDLNDKAIKKSRLVFDLVPAAAH